MKLHQTFQTKQIQTLKQTLHPKLIRLLKTFNYSYEELYRTVKEEQETNSFIEITQDDSLRSYTIPQHTTTSFMDDASDFSDIAIDQQQVTLEEHLNQQLPFLNLNTTDLRLVHALIEHIDDKGYLSDFSKVQEKIMATYNVSARKVVSMVYLIQELEPDGVGARNLQECLTIQIKHYHFENNTIQDLLLKLVTHYFTELSEKNYTLLASKLDLTEEGVEALHTFIKENLNPYPGSPFSQKESTVHIIPSFEVSIQHNNIHITNLEEEKGIQFSLSSRYHQLLQDPSLDNESKQYLEIQLEKAKELIESIKQRKENMEKLVHHIIFHQKEFIMKGLLYLLPLQQTTLSHDLSMSPSTISRILSSKYVITPHGTFSLKELCPRNHFGYTKERLTYLVKDLCNRYPNESDQKISHKLHELGIPIARRTVTKYRHIGLNQ